MGFDTLKSANNNENTKQPIMVKNTSDTQKKYDNKPKLEIMHKTIITNYPQSNEKNIQSILNILDKDLWEKAFTKWFDVINNLLKDIPDIFSWEKITNEINLITKIIKNAINKDDQENEKKQKDETIIESKKQIDNFYTQMPEEFKYQEETADPKIKQEADSLFLQAKDKLLWIDEERYKSNLYTALKLSKNNESPVPNKTEFINEFNKLNKLLDIDIEIPIFETRSLKTSENNPNSLDDLKNNTDKVLKSEDIQEYVGSSENVLDTIDISDTNMLKLYTPDDIQKSIDKALPPWWNKIDIKIYLKKWKIDKDKLEKDVDTESYNIIEKEITSLINDKKNKEEIKKTTNTAIKEKIITNVFKWLAKYFDVTNSKEENFAEDFKLNIANDDIKMNQKMINLNGSIKGYHVGFYYDMETGKLQMDDVVHKDENNIYQVGNNWGKIDLPTKLPTYKNLTDTAKDIDINEILEHEKVDSLDSYQTKLKSTLDKEFSKQFSHTELNKYYIEKYNEKNIAMQENLGYIFDNFWWTTDVVDFNKTQSYAIETKPEQYELLKIIDKSLDYYKNSGQYIQLRDAFERFNANIKTNSIEDPMKTHTETLIKELFNRGTMRESANNRKTGTSNDNKINYTTFYKMISNDLWIIDIKTLQTINTVIEGNNNTIGEQIEKDDSGFST